MGQVFLNKNYYFGRKRFLPVLIFFFIYLLKQSIFMLSYLLREFIIYIQIVLGKCMFDDRLLTHIRIILCL